MFSNTAEYALRSVILLAASGERLGGKQIAEKLGVPANYLSKILLQLCRAKILSSQKGWGGGFELALKPYKIRVLDVVKPFESPLAQRECILGKDLCSDRAPCPLHVYWKQIKNIYVLMTEKVTVGDLVHSAHAR